MGYHEEEAFEISPEQMHPPVDYFRSANSERVKTLVFVTTNRRPKYNEYSHIIHNEPARISQNTVFIIA